MAIKTPSHKPSKKIYWSLFLLFLLCGYATFSALWGNTESTVGQRGSTFLFLYNVSEYLIFFPKHIGGLIFDLPFSLLDKPEYIFLIFGFMIALPFFLLRSKSFQSLVIKYGAPIFILLGIASFIINILTIKSCNVSTEFCDWRRFFTPHIIGISGMALAILLPLSLLLKLKPIKQSLLAVLACCVLFILVYFICIYIPWEQNAKFARSYGIELMQSFEK